jgi:hypothetical protein
MDTLSAPPHHIRVDADSFFNDLWELPSHATHNPSPTPVTLRRSDLKEWKPPFDTHLVSEKSDGERVSILFGRTDDFKEESYIILFRRNRETRVLPVSKVSDTLFNGTLLDGEWIGNHFRIFDVMAIEGFNKKEKPFPERLQCAKQIIKEFAPVGWTIDVKEFVPLHDLSVLQSKIEAGNKGECDGLIFMPVEDSVTTGRAVNIKKWKPTWQNTIDLFHKNGTWMCVDNTGTLAPYPHIVMSGGTMKEGIFELKPFQRDGEIVWDIYTERTDKKVPNHISTIGKTFDTIRENITIEELRTCFK